MNDPETPPAADAPQGSLANELDRQIVESERLRVTIIAVVMMGYQLLYVLLDVFAPGAHHGLFHAAWQPAHVLAVGFPAIFFELWVRWRLGRFLRAGIPAPVYTRYATAFVESLIPTTVLLVQQGSVDPLLALGLPASYAYFFFIALATLHLSFSLCFFTAVACAVQYLLVALVVIDERLAVGSGDPTAPVPFQVWKAAFMITTGIVTGLVADRLRRGLEHAARSLESRRRVLDIFGKHVSPEVVEHLLAHDVALGGETRRVCVMFLDIRNFTAFSSTKKPEEVVAYLNRLFDFMVDSVNRHQGIVNKFLGDGFMAVFGAPVSDGHDSRNAVAAARDILARLEALNQSAAEPTRIGIGLHTGAAVAGTVGSAQRREYTLIGDTVNVASRVEQLNKQFGSCLLITEDVFHEVAGEAADAVCLGGVPVKGKDEPVQVYKLV